MLPESERIERDALADLHACAPPDVVDALDLRALSVDGALQSVAGALPASAIVVNRVLGLGLDGGLGEAQLERVVEIYRKALVERYFVQIHPSVESSAEQWLSVLGLERVRAWQKFQRGVEPTRTARTDLTIREAGAAHGESFARIVCDAFDLGGAAVPWLQHLPGRQRWRIFMSFDGDEPAGAGALFVDGTVGWLDFGATAPRFRQRGSQSALMAARIEHARALGCTTLFTCTGEDVPGDPQHSYRNILKAGFEPSYLRANYAPARGETK